MRNYVLLLSFLAIICFTACEKQPIDNGQLIFTEPLLDYNKSDLLVGFANKVKEYERRELLNESHFEIIILEKNEILERYEIFYAGENDQVFDINYIINPDKITSIIYFNPDILSYDEILSYAEQKGYQRSSQNSTDTELGTYYVNYFIDEGKDCQIKTMSFEPKQKDGKKILSITYDKKVI